MEISEQKTTPALLPADMAAAHIQQILSLFRESFGQTLNLEIPDHFIKLATIADLREWEHGVCDREGGLDYNRYDLACLLVQDHLKKQMPSQLLPDQQPMFVDALFPRLYSTGLEEYPRMIGDLRLLAGTCTDQDLGHELRRIREATDRIVISRDQAIKENQEIYQKSFDDAFHNPLLGFASPWYYDMFTRSNPDSIEAVLGVLTRRLER